MTQQEFEQLYGKEVSETEYVVINAMYMRFPNETKQDFVARYKKMGKGELLEEFAAIIQLSDAQEDALIKEKNDAVARAMEAERKAAKWDKEAFDLGVELGKEKENSRKANQELAELQQKLHDFAAMVAVETHQYDKTATIAACVETLGLAGYYRTLLHAGCVPTQEDLKMFVETLDATDTENQ